MSRTAKAVGSILGALVLLLAFRLGADWGSDYAPHYGSFAMSRGELAQRLNLLLLALPAALLLAWGVAQLAATRILDRYDALSGSSRSWEAALAIWVLLATWAIRQWVLQGTEVTDDENVYELQARLIETGRLFVPSLPAPFREFLDNQFVVNDGRRYGTYFIGHPVVLAAFRSIGLAAWTGPVLAATTALLAVATARRVFGARAAALAGALLASSPFFLCLSATHLSQPTLSLLLALYVYALVRIDGAPGQVRWWALAAAAISAGVLVRPQTAAPYLLVGAGPLAVALLRGRLEAGWRPVAAFLLVGAAGLAVFLWANAVRSGHPLSTGYAAYLAQGHRWLFPIGPTYSLRQLQESLGHLNFWLFGWPVSLAFLPFFARTPLSLRLAGLVAGSTLVYAASGVPTVAPVGPVYFGEAIPVLAALSGSGIERVVGWIRERDPSRAWAAGAAVLPAVLSALALVTFAPAQLVTLAKSATLTRAPYDLVEERGLQRAVVFVAKLPGLVYPPRTWAYYHRNADPDLADPVLYVRDLGPERDREFLRFLGGRSGWVMAFRDQAFVLEPLAAAPKP